MKSIRTTSSLCLVLCAALILEPALYAQDSSRLAAASAAAAAAQPDTSSAQGISSSLISSLPNAPKAQPVSVPAVPSAPVPEQIRRAKKIFIANAGDKTNLFPDVFSGGPDRPYVDFYSAMEKWGHYQIVSTPEQADLIFSVGIASPSAAEIAPTSGNLGPWNGAELHDVQLRLRILDPKSRISIWELDSHVNTPWGVDLKKTRDQSFDTAMNNLVLEVQQLSQQTMTTATSSVLTQPGHTRGINGVAIAGAVIGVIMIGIVAAVAVHMANQGFPPPPPPPPGFPPYPPAFR